MKKFGKFLYNVFIKNFGIKLLALILAAFAVAFINIPSEIDKGEDAATAVVYTQDGETNGRN